ncbi:MAG: putative N-acetyltransferase [Chlorobi bacterium]|nr:putative N-acetyltransferase [Chlorobiota bacterium]
MTGIPDIVIRPLSPELLDDYLAFFDTDAFADNPRWASCYCNWLHADHEAGERNDRTAAENRSAVIPLICERRMRGYLAYSGGRPVGWLSAAPRTLIPNIDGVPGAEGEMIGLIACFVVAKPYRGQGVARMLLSAACDGFHDQGCAIAEAYPLRNAEGEALNHFGPLAMYLTAGFQIVREDEGGRVIVRKILTER